MRAGPGQGESYYIESPELHALFVATKQWDKKLYAELRAGLRDAAKPLVAAVKAEIGRIPSSGRYRTGVRAGLQAGTRASIRASSAKSAGVRIVTSPSRLPAGKRPLVRAFNKQSSRHPTFGGGYVTQAGRPYFGSVILAHQESVRREMVAAVERAAAALAREVESK